MAPSKRFKPIQKLAGDRERKAATDLGVTLKNRDAARARLNDLQQYLAEYQQRFQAATRSGMGGSRLQEYVAFMAKLEEAIAEQRSVLENHQADCAASKAEWRGRYTRSRAVDKAVEKMRDRERKQVERSEQKASDDRSRRKR